MGPMSRRRATSLLGAGAWSLFTPRARAVTTTTNGLPPLPAPTFLDIPPWAQVETPVDRQALVIGVAAYEPLLERLPTPTIDADLVSTALAGLQFKVSRVPEEKTSYDDLLLAIKQFRDNLKPGDLALVYYSGHGMEIGGDNYLVPSGAPLVHPSLAGYTYVGLDHLRRELEEASPGLVLILLDACRTNPFAGQTPPPPPLAAQPELPADPDDPDDAFAPPIGASAAAAPAAPATTAGLAEMSRLPSHVIIAFAAAAGQVSLSLQEDHDPSLGSFYSRAFLASLRPHQRLSWILSQIRNELEKLIGKAQEPWLSATSFPEVMFDPNTAHLHEERNAWIDALMGANADLRRSMSEFIGHYPASLYSIAARRQILALDQQQAVQSTTEQLLVAQAADAVGAVGAPMSANLLSGALSSPTVVSGRAFAARAETSSSQDLFDGPRFWDRRVLERLPEGAQVTVLDSNPKSGAVRVRSGAGTVGFIKRVEVRPLEFARQFPITYDGDEADARFDSVGLDAAAAAAGERGTIVVRVGASGVADLSRADHVSYLRGLRLATELRRRRIRADQLSVATGTLTNLGKDQARLFVVP